MTISEGKWEVGTITTYICTYCNFFCELFSSDPKDAAKRLPAEKLEECIQQKTKKSPLGCYKVTYISELSSQEIVAEWSESAFPHECVTSLKGQIKLVKKILRREEGCSQYAVCTYQQVTEYGTGEAIQYTFQTEAGCCSLKVREI